MEKSNCAIDDIVTETKITWAVNTFKPFKSPGPDGFFPAQIQNSLDYIMEWLIVIFKATLKLECIPALWREVKVVFIPKAGKSSHISPKDFRPISLSSFLLKTLERIIEEYIKANINPSQLSISQHAYCKGKSTETALNSLITEIEKSIYNKEYTLVAFLDIEGAFNNILPETILQALTDLGIFGSLVDFIKNMLMSRFVNATLGDSKIRKKVSRGTPQGGVLSPLLWVLAINKLLKGLEESGAHIVAYADDVAMAVRGKFPNTLCEIMQGLLNSVVKWSKANGLNVNPNKTEMVLFTRKHNIPVVVPPSLSGTVLSIREEARYLGLILDRKLNWKSNVEDRVRKATIALYSCKRLIGSTWGLSPYIVNWLYTAIVRPILTYGVLVWWPALERGYIKKTMDHIQRMASLCICGALRTTPTDALNMMLNLLPIELFGRQVAAKSALRLREINSFRTTHKGHSTILEKFACIPCETDLCYINYINFNKSFITRFPSKEDWDNGLIENNNEITIYTDGSKLDNKVGGGVYSEKLEIRQSFRLPDHCSVFQAEVTAIKEGLTEIKTRVLSANEVFIYSDSQSAVKALESKTHSSKTVIECFKLLNDVSQYYKVHLIWVPGHRNIAGNCKADELARIGTTLDIQLDKTLIPMPIATCKLLIDRETIRIVNTKWQNLTTCELSKLTWPKLNSGRSKCLLKLNRENTRTLIGVLTGHCLIGNHARRLGVPYHDYCRSCYNTEEEETIKHLLCECEGLARRRLYTLGRAFLTDVADIAHLKLTKLSSFIKATGWFRRDPIV